MDQEQEFYQEFSCGLEPQECQRLLTLKGTDVKTLLSRYHIILTHRGSFAQALKKSLESPIPIGSDSSSLKDFNASLVLETLSSSKSSEIPLILSGLNSLELDLLFKFVYKGMTSPSIYNSSILLSWHEKILEIAGVGGIVRVLTDSRTV